MSVADVIQTVVALISLVTLVILVYQTKLQNDIFRAQIVKDRFDMYWSWKSITEEDIDEAELQPEAYFDKRRYESDYLGNREAVRRYLCTAHEYEYLAFAYQLRVLKLPDPLERMHTKWLIDLMGRKEFGDIHSHLRSYYPEFAAEVHRHRGIGQSADPL
jgi:hypothetical protein